VIIRAGTGSGFTPGWSGTASFGPIQGGNIAPCPWFRFICARIGGDEQGEQDQDDDGEYHAAQDTRNAAARVNR